MFELLGILVFLTIAAIIGVATVACGALTGLGMLFDGVGGLIGAVVGLIVFGVVMVALALVALAFGLLSWLF